MTEQERQQLINDLKLLMADNVLFKIKVQYCHHNVKGMSFMELHGFFQDIYEELEEATDVYGEQIRILGEQAPGSAQEFLDLADLNEFNVSADPTAEEMLMQLYEDNDHIRDHLTEFEQHAAEAGNEAVLDFFVERHRQHDMYHYFLSSYTMNI